MRKFFTKYFVMLIFFQFAAFNLRSQDIYSNHESSFAYFKLGITNTGLYRDSVDYDRNFFMNGGVGGGIVFSDKINACGEILYTVKSVKTISPVIKYRFGFIDVPLFVQYKFNDIFRINLGTQYSLLVNSKYEILDIKKISGVASKGLSTKNTNDISVLAGAEINLMKSLVFELRYSVSSKYLLDRNTPYFSVIQLAFNYHFFSGYRQLFKQKSNEKK